MRRYQFTHEARTALDAQIDYLINQHAHSAAEALNLRVHTFVNTTLVHFPATGRFISQRNIWETWIPHTRLIVWYVFTDETLTIVAVWHHAQDRHR